MIRLASLAAIGAVSALAAPSSSGVCQPLSSLSFTYPPTVVPEVSARVIYKGLKEPRAMKFDAAQNLLVLERYLGVTALTFHNDTTCVGWERRVVVEKADLQHGIEVGPGNGRNQYLYASSMENVYRWEYDPANAAVIGGPVIVAWNMSNVNPIQPDHITRTLLLQSSPNGKSQSLIVTRGATGNWDETAANVTSGPAQIRRFPLDSTLPAGTGWAWQQGEVLGWGLRNAVGIAFSKDGKDLWEVENSSDNVVWRGVDVHQDNPAEELNRIPLSSSKASSVNRKYYGYPSCFTAWDSSKVPTNGSLPVFKFKTGEQFSVKNPPAQPDDAWCADARNNIKPALPIQAHSAPLDIVFYDRSKCAPASASYGLTKVWDGDAFISLHGSWNRDSPTGYKVVRVPWVQDRPVAKPDSKTGYETVVAAPDLAQCPDKCIRPTGLLVDMLGRLFVSSDATGEIFVVQNSVAP